MSSPIQKINIKGVSYDIEDHRISNELLQDINETIDTVVHLPEPSSEIDDTVTAVNKTWSSQKIVQEISDALSNIPVGLTIRLVNSLPQIGENNVLYLVPKTNYETNNIKDEYLYINNLWEKIGDTTTNVDLSNYYNKQQTYSKQEVDALIAALPDNDTQYRGDDATIEVNNNVISVKQGAFDYTAGSDKVEIDNVHRTIDVNLQSIQTDPVVYEAEDNSPITVDNNTHKIGFDSSQLDIPEQIEYDAEDNSPITVNNSTRKIGFDSSQLDIPQPIQYQGSNGIVVDNNTHTIKLKDGIIPQEPEIPSNYYQYNNLNIVVPQSRGIIRLAHDYIMPSGANPSVYERGVYIEDVTIPVPATAQELEYMTVKVQYPVNNGPDNAPLFATIDSHYAASSAYSYNHPQQFRIPINAKGAIVRDTNTQQYYYDEILRDGDFCYDNVGNLFVIDNLKSDISGSGNWIDFRLIPKLRAYYNDDNSVSADMFTVQRFKSSDYSSNYSSSANHDDVYSYSAELNGQTFGELPHSNNNYQYTYRFISAYKNPETEKVFYVYGTPDESVALGCYLREMDNGNTRPAFAGFLLFGTPWSLEPPIERNDTELEIAASTWIEPRPQIFYIEASSINNNVSNIDTTNLQENDVVVIKNPSTSISYQDDDDTITINDLSFEPQFRYDGTGFKPMFCYANETSHYITDSDIGWVEH